MKAVLIDHDDSFTHNLRHWLKPAFTEVSVINHRDFFNSPKAMEAAKENTLVVLSPGPKNPSDYPQTLSWLKEASPRLPVYGVCLGLQMMVLSSGALVKPYTPPLHGKKSKLKILSSDSENFFGLAGLEVARYHSLYCEVPAGSDFETLAVSEVDQVPMWLKHKNKKWLGVQFHPESFLTEKSDRHLAYLKKWLA